MFVLFLSIVKKQLIVLEAAGDVAKSCHRIIFSFIDFQHKLNKYIIIIGHTLTVYLLMFLSCNLVII